MSGISRNAPCPCGSGRKYRQCCLARDEERRGAAAHDTGAVSEALAWLDNHHRGAMTEAFDQFFATLSPEEKHNVGRLSEDTARVIEINANEWLLAEAEVEVSDQAEPASRVKVSQLVLGPGGARLTPAQRGFIESMAATPLCPYEVLEVERDSGIRIRDVLMQDVRPIWISDRSLSRSLKRSELIALRLIESNGAHVASGCVYHYPPPLSSQVLEELRAFLREFDAGLQSDSAHPAGRRSVSAILRDRWLLALTRTRKMPEIVDRRTNDPGLLCEDHFRVVDWAALERALADQPEVEGNRAQGWARMEDTDGEWRSSLWSMRVGPRGDTLIGFGRTRSAADEGRVWLESIAGLAVRFQAREIVDPRSPAAYDEPRGAPRNDPLRDMTREQRTAAFQQIHEQIYRHWADEPVPALGNRTPREAVRTPEGREQVARLLKDYEAGEARRARGEDRDPTKFGFLWASVGLERKTRASRGRAVVFSKDQKVSN